MNLNDLQSTAISPGQYLIVGKYNNSYNNKIDMTPPQSTTTDKKAINDKQLEEFIRKRNLQIPNEVNRV